MFAFTMAKRVRWAEVDPQAIVFNANYLVYADIAFTEYMRALGMPFPNPMRDAGTDVFAVRSEVNFRAPARFDDELVLAVRTVRIGRSSFTVEIEVRRGENVLAEVRTVYVNANPEARASAPLPQFFIDRILAFEAAPPDRA